MNREESDLVDWYQSNGTIALLNRLLDAEQILIPFSHEFGWSKDLAVSYADLSKAAREHFKKWRKHEYP